MEGFVHSDKAKKKKQRFFKKKAHSQPSNTMATSSVNGGSPFDSQSLGSCSLKLAGEPTLRLVKSSQEAGQCSSSCKGRAGGRSISILSSVLREKPQGAEKQHEDGNDFCLLFSAVSAFGKKRSSISPRKVGSVLHGNRCWGKETY